MADYITLLIMIIILTFVSTFIAYKSFKTKTETGKRLAFAMIFCSLVGINYIISVSVTNYTVMSIFSSLYFFSVSAMMLFVFSFVFHFCGYKRTNLIRVAIYILMIWAAFDFTMLFINIFKEIVISYEIVDPGATVGKFKYIMNPLFDLHLIFSYIMVASVFGMLIAKAVKVPREYRMQYLNIVFIIFAIVVVNALFLFLPNAGISLKYDYSIAAYFIGEAFCYWGAFVYTKSGMISRFKTDIFDNIEQGMILFDYEGNLLAHNQKADLFLPNVDFFSDVKINEVKAMLNMNLKSSNEQIFQVSIPQNNLKLRCNYKSLKNSRGYDVGYLFVLTDETFDVDLLTGFHNYSSFKKSIGKIETKFPIHMCVIDINGLSLINASYGHNKGDELIKSLSIIIKHIFPEDSYFLRGEEAELAVLSTTLNSAQMSNLALEVRNSFDESIQFAINKAYTYKEMEPAFIQAVQSMRAKKLLDKESSHSSLLTSLIKALEECDTDTEEHVRRTQLVGRKLGVKIGLSDMELSDLSLLCILHDIGKIGIPLEIINKPSRLDDSEWELMRSHVEKGYHIARSTKQLEGIADMIRYHHERWDGKGYPDGLSMESIPILSRVISVVDSFDAMTHDRIYRKAMSIDDAKKELQRCAGTQFDPSIVRAFLNLIEEDEEIRNEIENDSDYVEVNVEVNDEDSLVKNKENDELSEVTSNTHAITYSRYILDNTIRILEVDDYFEKLTGYTKEDVIDNNMTQLDLIPPVDRIDYYATIQEPIAGHGSAYLEHRIQRKDGQIIFVFCYGRNFYDSAQKMQKTEIIVANVVETHMIGLLTENEAKRAEKRLRQWENTYRRDSLTNLFTHQAYKSDIEDKILKEENKVLFIMLDVDKFKEYNDTYGHHAGDEFLIHLAQSMEAVTLEEDLNCRMGGDEFSICCFGSVDTPDNILMTKAKNIFDKLSVLVKKLHGYTISMGAIIANTSNESFISLYEKADIELYNAKHNGRNNISIRKI